MIHRQPNIGLATTVMVLAALFIIAVPDDSEAQRRARGSDVTVGIVLDGPWDTNDDIVELFQREIRDLLRGEYNVQFPEDKRLVADWTVESVREALDTLYADNSVDVVIAMGILASNDSGRRSALPKLTVAPFVVDPTLQDIPLTRRGTSGRRNLAYLALPTSFRSDLETLQSLASFNHVAVMVHSELTVAVPELSARIQGEADALGLRVTVVPVGSSASEALSAIPADAEAVYVRTLLQLDEGERDALFAGFISRKLPSFSLLGRADVERGVLMGNRPSSDFTLFARQTALHLQQMLAGGNAAQLPVRLELTTRLTINLATARAIGRVPGWTLATEAELIDGGTTQGGRSENLASVAQAVLSQSLDVAVARERLNAGKQQTNQARANLLPKIDLESTARLIDEDSALASFGLEPERLWTATARLTQPLLVEQAWAGFSVQRRLEKSREYELRATELDVVLAAASAYLDVLRAKALVRIQQQNLDTTRSNLQRARSRVAIGAGTRAEVFRFELQIANDRKAVIDAFTGRQAAEIALNRILGHPLEESFSTAEAAIDDQILLTRESALLEYLQDPGKFTIFRRFMVEDTVNRLPEIAAVDEAIQAQERAVTSSRLSYVLPTLALVGQVDRRLYTGGSGSDGLPPDLGLPPIDVPDTSWFVGLQANFPLFTGGNDYARSQEIKSDLRRLRYQRQLLVRVHGQRLRTGLLALSAAYTAIALSNDAAEAARQNLALVTDSYDKGVTTVVELIDAQNSALVAELLAANAVYDFLLQWMNVQRVAGRFDLLMDGQERSAFFTRAAAFVQSNSRGQE